MLPSFLSIANSTQQLVKIEICQQWGNILVKFLGEMSKRRPINFDGGQFLSLAFVSHDFIFFKLALKFMHLFEYPFLWDFVLNFNIGLHSSTPCKIIKRKDRHYNYLLPSQKINLCDSDSYKYDYCQREKNILFPSIISQVYLSKLVL